MEWVACVGIDWADQKHDYAVIGADGSEERGSFASSGEGVHEWVRSLRRRSERHDRGGDGAVPGFAAVRIVDV
jgi:hypothetical protein